MSTYFSCTGTGKIEATEGLRVLISPKYPIYVPLLHSLDITVSLAFVMNTTIERLLPTLWSKVLSQYI